jgi:hypothetical protein
MVEMNVLPKPTSLLLVGAIFISLLFSSGSADQYSNRSAELNKLKEISSDLIPPQKKTDLGQLEVDNDTIFYPWASRHALGINSHLLSSLSRIPAKNEEVFMNNSRPSARVPDLPAINSIINRDLHFNDSQNGDFGDQRLVNSLDIDVVGTGNNAGANHPKIGSETDDIWLQNNAAVDQSPGDNYSKHVGNYLNIDVSGISVSALNTVEGGSAVATSNIIIEPVQILVCDHAVRDKLR